MNEIMWMNEWKKEWKKETGTRATTDEWRVEHIEREWEREWGAAHTTDTKYIMYMYIYAVQKYEHIGV